MDIDLYLCISVYVYALMMIESKCLTKFNGQKKNNRQSIKFRLIHIMNNINGSIRIISGHLCQKKAHK